jgi:hypothetical protein
VAQEKDRRRKQLCSRDLVEFHRPSHSLQNKKESWRPETATDRKLISRKEAGADVQG